MNTLYLQARRAFQGKEKERRAESLSARTLTLFALHIQLCLAHTFGLLIVFFSFSFAVTRTAIRISFLIVSSLLSGGLGAVSPQRTKPQENLRLLIGTLAHKVPACYGVRHTPMGIFLPFPVTCTVRERPHTVLVDANRAFDPFFCAVGITFLVSAVSIAE